MEVVLDKDSFDEFCAQEGLPVSKTLAQFKQAGVTTIALSETTLEKLREQGLIRWDSQATPLRIVIVNQALRPWISNALTALPGPGSVTQASNEIRLRGDPEDLTQTGLGIYPNEASELARLGFYIAPRLENRNALTASQLAFLLDNLAELPHVSAVVFTGARNEVLGYDAHVSQVAEFLKSHGYRYGYIEAYEKNRVQKGAETLAEKAPDNVIKVQGLLLPPWTRLDPEKALETFLLGVRERNIKVIYFHPFLISFQGKNLLQENLDFLQQLKTELGRAGYPSGISEPYPIFTLNFVWILAAVLGVAAALFLLAGLFTEISGMFFWIAVVIGFAATLVLVRSPWNGPWLSMLALGAAIIFPILGLVWFSPKTSLGFSKSVLNLISATLMTIAGGVFVWIFLANNLTLLGISEFRGVKAVLVLPTILSPWLAWLYRNPGARSRDIFLKPVKVYHLIVGLGLVALGVFMILRSGNTLLEGGVPAFEKVIRSFLESIFVARPRFKEFFIGHPFFLLACGLGLSNGWGVFSFFLGSLGQADIMDSFAHLHTPIRVTLLRTFHGIWLGIVIGFILRYVTMHFRSAQNLKKSE